MDEVDFGPRLKCVTETLFCSARRCHLAPELNELRFPATSSFLLLISLFFVLFIMEFNISVLGIPTATTSPLSSQALSTSGDRLFDQKDNDRVSPKQLGLQDRVEILKRQFMPRFFGQSHLQRLYDYLGLGPTASSPHDAMIVAIDFENGQSFEGDLSRNQRSEVGLATLDTRNIGLVSPDSQISTYNFVSGNKPYQKRASERFLFGKSVDVQQVDMLKSIESVIPHNRNIILIGHDINNDLRALVALGFNFQRPIIMIVNICSIAPELIGIGQRTPRLRTVLKRLEIPRDKLHCGGNDAHFTLRALLLIVARKYAQKHGNNQKLRILRGIAQRRLPESRKQAIKRARKKHEGESRSKVETRAAKRKASIHIIEEEREMARQERAARRSIPAKPTSNTGKCNMSPERNGDKQGLHAGLALECLFGGSLSDHLPLSHYSEARLEWPIQVTEAVQYIHKENVVHGDFSCHSFIIQQDGSVALAYFDDPEAESTAQVGCATRGQVSQDISETPRTASIVKDDLFALGSVLYEISVGETLSPRESSRDMAKSFQKHDFPHLTAVRDLRVRAAIWKCWNQEYHSAEEVLRDLRTASSRGYSMWSFLHFPGFPLAVVLGLMALNRARVFMK